MIIVKKWRLDHKSKGFIWADLLISGAEWFVVLFFCCRGGTSPCKHVNLWLFDMNQESYVFIKHSLLPRSLSLSLPSWSFFSLSCASSSLFILSVIFTVSSLSLSLFISLPSLPPFLPSSLSRSDAFCSGTWRGGRTWPERVRDSERDFKTCKANTLDSLSPLQRCSPSFLPPFLPPSLPVQCYRVQSQSLV